MENLTLETLEDCYNIAKSLKQSGNVVVRYNPNTLHFSAYKSFTSLNMNRQYNAETYVHILPIDEFMNMLMTMIVDFKPKKHKYELKYDVHITVTCVETVEAYNNSEVRKYYANSPFNIIMPSGPNVVECHIVDNEILEVNEKE
jgi:hypothetical protein